MYKMKDATTMMEASKSTRVFMEFPDGQLLTVHQETP